MVMKAWMIAKRMIRFFASISIDDAGFIDGASEDGGQVLYAGNSKDDAGNEDPQAGVNEEG